MTNMLRLLIASDSVISTIGIENSIERNNDFCIVDICKDYESTIKAIKTIGDIDIIIINFIEEEKELKLSSHLNELRPDIRRIILTTSKNITHIIAEIQQHITAYIINDISPEELATIIRSANFGHGLYFGGSAPIDKLLETFGSNRNLIACKPYELTQKELNVLKLLSKGKCSKEIAKTLNICYNTVETYKERIKRKLGVNTIIEAVVFGVEKNII